MQGKTIADRAGATLWGRLVVWWTGQAPSVPSGLDVHVDGLALVDVDLEVLDGAGLPSVLDAGHHCPTSWGLSWTALTVARHRGRAPQALAPGDDLGRPPQQVG